MTQCIKCGGTLTRKRNCKHCGPQPPTHVTKMKDLINMYTPTAPKPFCIGCNKFAHELEEYQEMAKLEDMSPDDYARREEGTYNRVTGHFLCTLCYIDAGMPSGPNGWIAP